ncbi:MAG: response regulator [Elusimicrobia bacterium]|nr:response regulator [Elusimicrobiota bacterium]
MTAAPPKRRILVADDDKECQSFLRDALTELGYDVTVVSDGAALYRRAVEDPPDLIISDLDMPGLSGGTAEALLRAEARTRSVPILFVTGQGEERQARLVEFRPGLQILRKPLKLTELAAAVAEHLPPP